MDWTFLASYTNSKLISDSVVSIGFGNVEQVGTVGYQKGLYDRRAERSLDPTDVAQRLVLSGVYELPVGKGRRLNVNNSVLNIIAGGWQIDSIALFQGGVPVVVTGASNFLALAATLQGRARTSTTERSRSGSTRRSSSIRLPIHTEISAACFPMCATPVW